MTKNFLTTLNTLCLLISLIVSQSPLHADSLQCMYSFQVGTYTDLPTTFTEEEIANIEIETSYKQSVKDSYEQSNEVLREDSTEPELLEVLREDSTEPELLEVLREDATEPESLDDIGLYLQKISPTPLLNKAEEAIFGNDIAELEKEMRSTLLENDYIFKELVKVLGHVLNKKVRIEGPISTTAAKSQKNKELRKLISSSIESLNAKVKQHHEMFLTSLDAKQTKAKQTFTLKQLSESRTTLPKTLEPFFLRVNTLKLIYKKMSKINDEVQQIAARLESPEKESVNNIRTLKVRMTYLLQQANETPTTLKAKTAKAKDVYDRYFNKRKEFANHNLKLVVFIAKRYQTITKTPFMDLIQAGNVGLLRATLDFKPQKGFKFSTYAYNWIKLFITREMTTNHENGSHIPIDIHYLMNDLNQIYDQELLKTETKLSLKELLYRYKINKITKKHHKTTSTAEIEQATQFAKEKYESMRESLQLMSSPIELDSEQYLDRGKTLSIRIPAKGKSESLVKSENNELASILGDALDDLSEVEAQVLRLRNGFYNDTVYTQEVTGKFIGKSWLRVQQIEKRALEKLRDRSIRNGLHSYDNTAE